MIAELQCKVGDIVIAKKCIFTTIHKPAQVICQKGDRLIVTDVRDPEMKNVDWDLAVKCEKGYRKAFGIKLDEIERVEV